MLDKMLSSKCLASLMYWSNSKALTGLIYLVKTGYIS